jgi:hypothetical protein
MVKDIKERYSYVGEAIGALHGRAAGRRQADVVRHLTEQIKACVLDPDRPDRARHPQADRVASTRSSRRG